MDREWIKTRRALLKSVKMDVRRRLGEEPDDLKAYDREARQLAKRRYRVSSKSEILAEIESADVVYGGDFHAHGPAQRTHYKMLRHIAPDRPVILGLECFDRRSQKYIEAFLRGRIDAESLRKRSQWDERWGFPFEHYRALLELAKRRHWRVEALGVPQELAGEGLKNQDFWISKQLKALMTRVPGSLIYLVIGELHLTHVPRLLAREFQRPRKIREVVIHLNAESVYFELAAKGLEHTVDVIRYADAGKKAEPEQIVRFSILSSPPWVPWQSYLLHLDKTMELEWENSAEESDEDFDPTDHVRKLVEWIAKDIGISSINTSDLAVYASSDAKLWRKVEASLKGKDRDFARRMLVRDRSFMLPDIGVGCLAQTTVNHASHLAAEYLQVKASGRKRTLWNFPSDFQAAILIEGLAYFGSKLINHKRQSETMSDLRSALQSIQPTDEGRDALRLALDQRMSELVYFHQGRRRKRLVKPLKLSSYLEAALILGRMLGERLYGAYRARKISKKEVASLFRTDVLRRDFGREYDSIVVRLARAVGTEIAPSGLLPVKARRERI